MHNVNLQKREIQIGSRRISIETGKLAKQADGSVIVRSGDTVVLVTACHAANPREGIDFLPLTVDYREYTYASGRIPGGFFKREGKPPEKEVLTSRLIDRPIRPLFAQGWKYETQIISLLLSADTENDADVSPSPAPRPRSRCPRSPSRRPSRVSASGSWTAITSSTPRTPSASRARWISSSPAAPTAS